MLVALGAAYLLTGNFFKETERLADTPYNFMISYLYFGAVLLLWQLYRVRHAADQGDLMLHDRAATAPEAPRA